MWRMPPRPPSPSEPGWGLVLVRLAVGMTLVQAGWQKITEGVGPWIVESAASRIASSPEYYSWWGQEILLRWPDLFAVVLSWGAFVTGCALFLGLLVRPAGWFAALLLANVYFAGPALHQPYVLLLAVCAVACAVGRAGRRVGFDELLDPRLPVWLTWARA